MRDILYYPGCSLKDSAKGFEDSALKVSEDLGIHLEEIPRWNCCGTVYSLTDDNLMKQVAPIRNLIRTQEEEGHQKLYTLCSMCDNTLKRANALVKKDGDKLDKMNNFMDREEDYEGEVEVRHYLELLRDELGWEAIEQPVINPLEDLKVAPYYGCMLTRPKEIGLDDPHNPTVIDDLIESLGGEPVDYPYKQECCGSYNTVDNEEVVMEKSRYNHRRCPQGGSGFNDNGLSPMSVQPGYETGRTYGYRARSRTGTGTLLHSVDGARFWPSRSK